MIIVTQGHQAGIGLEVFFKSILVSDKHLTSQIKLLAFQESVASTLKNMGLPFKLTSDYVQIAHQKIATTWLTEVNCSESFTAIKKGMEICEKGHHILFTLPTSKDQFPGFSGHTEFFRSYYNLPELGMFFLSPELKVLLISDHIPLRDVPLLAEGTIFERLSNALKQFKQWQWPIQKVLIAGINPHGGEGGLIGNEDEKITKTIKRLQKSFSYPISGPISADTMVLAQTDQNDLLVYPYHDQGLGVFKALQGFIGANITLGLKYPRFSPDHGTSFALYGHNKADYRGCAYALREALKLMESING